MRTGAALFLLAAATMLAAVPGSDAIGDVAGEGGGDVWSEHAVSDGDAARAGRAAMPFTAEQIEALGRLLRETQRAASVAADPPPEGRIRRVRIGTHGDGTIPAIAVRKGYVTAVSFTDATGAPWPIEEVLLDDRFVPGTAEADDEAGRRSEHLFYLAPQARALHGNAVVRLQGLAEPLALVLQGGGSAADFGVEVRLGLPGPNAATDTPGRYGFHAGDPVLLDLLGGVAPQGAERLAVDGGERDDRAWRLGGDLLLLTRAHLLSPGPWAAERGASGRWAYRLPHTPYALATRDGRERRLAFSEPEEIPAPTAADTPAGGHTPAGGYTGSEWND